jgi:hypothetical protein
VQRLGAPTVQTVVQQSLKRYGGKPLTDPRVCCLFLRLPTPYNLTSLGKCISPKISAPAFANGRNVPKGIGFEEIDEKYSNVGGSCSTRSVVRFTGDRPADDRQRARHGKDDYDIIDACR